MPIPIILPKFGFTLESSTIVQWLKHEGDSVRNGDPICEVTTDKVNMEIEAPEAGTIYGLRYEAGAEVPVTDIICYLARQGEQIPVEAAPLTANSTISTPLARRVAEAEQIDLSAVSGSGPNGRIMRRDVDSALTQKTGEVDGKVRATPAARHLAAQAGIALEQVRGSGPRGRVQAADVEAVKASATLAGQKAVTTAVPATVEAANAPMKTISGDVPKVVKLTGMRKTIATRLQKSYQTAPHIFLEMQIDTAAIDALRATLKKQDKKLSVTALLVRACAGVLMRHPIINATMPEEDVLLWPHANIGVAVALEDGLIVPIIQHADELGLHETQKKLDELSHRARTSTLHINDMIDGTFTISNLGMYGIDRFTAIINPPQVAILAVGRSVKQFVPDAHGQPVLRSSMALVLSADHRVVDGANAAQFLADLKQILEEPALLLW